MTQNNRKPFAGCERALSSYKLIGDTLLTLEEFRIRCQLSNARYSIEFRERVAHLPVEILESYLEDLLDMEVNDKALFIKRKLFWQWGVFIATIGLILTLLGSLYLYINSASPMVVTFNLILGAVPSMTLFYMSPPTKLIRRMGFAQLVSQEIARRRGRRDPKGKIAIPLWSVQVFEDFFRGKAIPEPFGNTARESSVIVH